MSKSTQLLSPAPLPRPANGLLTSEEFLDWLQPGVHADLFSACEHHGVQEYWILDPHKLAHRFYRRAGDMFEEFAIGAPRVDSASIPGFWVKREWLNPDKLPAVSACLSEILKQRKPRGRGGK